MSRNQRLLMLGLAALVAVVALVVLPGGGDDEPRRAAATSTIEAAPRPAASTSTDTTTTETAPKPKPKPKPQPPLLRAGRERELEFTKGETIRFRVRHTADEEIHVHGYDKSKDIKAGRTTTMSFKANLEGIFEIELEHSGTPLGTLKVEPK
jgi:hypothetical protein